MVTRAPNLLRRLGAQDGEDSSGAEHADVRAQRDGRWPAVALECHDGALRAHDLNRLLQGGAQILPR